MNIPEIASWNFTYRNHNIDNSLVMIFYHENIKDHLNKAGYEIIGYSNNPQFKSKKDCVAVMIFDVKLGEDFWIHVPKNIFENALKEENLIPVEKDEYFKESFHLMVER